MAAAFGRSACSVETVLEQVERGIAEVIGWRIENQNAESRYFFACRWRCPRPVKATPCCIGLHP